MDILKSMKSSLRNHFHIIKLKIKNRTLKTWVKIIEG
jgi:hypothetical protein